MIKMGGRISRGLKSVSTQNQRCHQLLLFTRDPTFFFVHVHVNAFPIQLHCQKLFSSYLGYKKIG